MVNRQSFAMWLGLLIVFVHIVMSLYLWFVFDYGRNEDVFIKEISLPVTLGYSVSIVKWFLDNHGIVTSNQRMGAPFVFLIAMISIAFLGGLISAPIVYGHSPTLTADELNNFYLFIESAFGVMFSLIFSYLYGDNGEANKVT
jgi:hypothetical protein